MKKILSIILFIHATYFCLEAQIITFNFDRESAEKINAYNALNINKKTIQVYRIQFGVTSERRQMEIDLAQFEKEFNIKTDWHQNGPYFYLKAGNYLSKLASFDDFRKIKNKFPGSIYLVETINKNILIE